MFRDGDSNVVRCTTFVTSGTWISPLPVLGNVALDAVVDALEVLAAAVVLDVLAAEVVAALDDAVTVTVFDPVDPHPASSSATPANAPIVLVTIDSLYREQPTGRFQP
jgi:hypothetical protein